MAARLPPELAGELYCRANLEPMIHQVMTPQIAIELLDKAWHMLSTNQISFSFNYIDKPKENMAFFLKVQPDEIIMPHDGYQYMDDEVTYSYPPDPRLTITERSQGFSHGDQYTHIVRRKYTLVQQGRDTLAFLHYSKADISRSVVVDGRRAKTPARQYPLKQIPGTALPPPLQAPQQPYQQAYRPQQPPKMQHPYVPSPAAAMPVSPQQPGGYGRFSALPAPVGGPPGQQPPQRVAPVNAVAYGNQRHDKKSSHKKHHQQQQQQLTPQQQAQVLAQQQAQAQEDAEDPSGDELDFLTARDVAIARYKRNHDYIAEVFSPYPTSRITPPRPEYEKSIEFLKALSSKHEIDLEAVREEHDEKIKKFKADASVFYRGLEDLKQATTVQEVFAANERVESYMGMTVQPYLGLRQVELPKDEATRTPELKPARVQKQPPAPDTAMVVDSVQDAVSVAADPVPQPAPIIPVAVESLATNGITALDAPIQAQVASESMEMDLASVIPVQEINTGIVSEDTEMGNNNDVTNEFMTGVHQETTVPTVTMAVMPSDPVFAAQETQSTITPAPQIQPEPMVSDVMMEKQQNLMQEHTQAPVPVASIVEHTPVVAAVTSIVEVSAMATVLETSTPIPVVTTSVEEQMQPPVIPAAQELPMVTETFVQESFTSSVTEGDHITTTTSSSYTTSSTDTTGMTVTDTAQSEGTTVEYADGHQEVFPQEAMHQHVVEHTDIPPPLEHNVQQPAQIEAIPESTFVESTVTITELQPTELSVVDGGAVDVTPQAGFVSTPVAVPTTEAPAPVADEQQQQQAAEESTGPGAAP
ncbi:hypothetical protein BGZ58_004221 [Dissophora ornata]|nr:hypothetical protein BGZ58_004221 [Dissophora ornata]